MTKFLMELLQAVATAAVPVCAAFLIQFLRRKSAQIGAQTDSLTEKQVLAEVTNAVTTAVAFTSQTYVDALKSAGEFDKAAQSQAAQKAFKACKSALSAEAVAFIEAHYGDLTKYLSTKIEAEVRAQKLEAPSKAEEKQSGAVALGSGKATDDGYGWNPGWGFWHDGLLRPGPVGATGVTVKSGTAAQTGRGVTAGATPPVALGYRPADVGSQSGGIGSSTADDAAPVMGMAQPSICISEPSICITEGSTCVAPNSH